MAFPYPCLQGIHGLCVCVCVCVCVHVCVCVCECVCVCVCVCVCEWANTTYILYNNAMLKIATIAITCNSCSRLSRVPKTQHLVVYDSTRLYTKTTSIFYFQDQSRTSKHIVFLYAGNT